MKNPRDIVKRPIITEKTSDLMAENKYTFAVDVRSNKVEVKQAIEAIFNVKVESVNIINVKPKAKRVGRHSGYKARVKKAIVKLAEGQSIEIFEV